MLAAVLLALSVQLASSQETPGGWNWNPWQQQWQPGQVAHGVAQQDGINQRLQLIYGIPGQRNANQKLRVCCRSLKDADVECRRRFCDFNAFRPDQVLGYLAQCSPKGPTVGQMWDCASSRADHTQCCQQQGVLPACMAYCETTNGVPTDYFKYALCIGQFDKIRTCFYEYLQAHPSIKGDT